MGLVTALNKLPCVGDEKLYRGINWPAPKLNGYSSRQATMVSGITSTSLTESVCKGFAKGNSLLTYQDLEGVNIARYSSYPEQQEIILIPGQEQVVLNAEGILKQIEHQEEVIRALQVKIMDVQSTPIDIVIGSPPRSPVKERAEGELSDIFTPVTEDNLASLVERLRRNQLRRGKPGQAIGDLKGDSADVQAFEKTPTRDL